MIFQILFSSIQLNNVREGTKVTKTISELSLSLVGNRKKALLTLSRTCESLINFIIFSQTHIQ